MRKSIAAAMVVAATFVAPIETYALDIRTNEQIQQDTQEYAEERRARDEHNEVGFWIIMGAFALLVLFKLWQDERIRNEIAR